MNELFDFLKWWVQFTYDNWFLSIVFFYIWSPYAHIDIGKPSKDGSEAKNV